MANIEKTLCSKAWTDLNLDFAKRQLRHCCKSVFESFPDELTFDFFNNSDRIIERRDDLLNGVEHSDCKHCWLSYSNTGTAYRDFENTWTTPTDLSKDLKFVEIMLDNICDMSCIYCDSDFSSKIASEKRLKTQLKQPKEKDLELFVDWLSFVLSNQEESCTLSFLGGEITYSKNFYLFIEKLLQNKNLHNKSIIFSGLTNGNSTLERNKKFLNILDKLPESWSVNIAISNEAIGKNAELVRWGLNWDRFKHNFELYIQHPKISFVCLSPTPCLFTIDSLPHYLQWAIDLVTKYDKKLTIAGNWIVYPTEIDVARCKISKKKIVNNIIDICVNNRNVFAFDSEYKKTIKWLEKLSDRIGTMPLDTEKLDLFLMQKIKEKDQRVDLLRNYI